MFKKLIFVPKSLYLYVLLLYVTILGEAQYDFRARGL